MIGSGAPQYAGVHGGSVSHQARHIQIPPQQNKVFYGKGRLLRQQQYGPVAMEEKNSGVQNSQEAINIFYPLMWCKIIGVHLYLLTKDEIKWQLTANVIFSSQSAYSLLCGSSPSDAAAWRKI